MKLLRNIAFWCVVGVLTAVIYSKIVNEQIDATSTRDMGDDWILQSSEDGRQDKNSIKKLRTYYSPKEKIDEKKKLKVKLLGITTEQDKFIALLEIEGDIERVEQGDQLPDSTLVQEIGPDQVYLVNGEEKYFIKLYVEKEE